MATPPSVEIAKESRSPSISDIRETSLTYNSSIQQYRTENYQDSCQNILTEISNVQALVEELKDIESIYYPTAASLNVLNLENKNSLGQLMDDCLDHLKRLEQRVQDASSKILVTGDLNSGKSTLVNALLKKELLPMDQQPCTSLFCQVFSSSSTTDDQVHAVLPNTDYSKQDQDTFHVIEPRHLYKLLIDDDTATNYTMINIYTSRHPDLATTTTSLLHNNDILDIALIDSPGLNTNSVQTTAVMARQEQIDVVVFVLSAENHFTLSGKEFLTNASLEKTHIFIVVNRFDQIRDKERCKRLILEQIKQLSPATYAQAEDLVHFVSSHQVDTPDFIKLEQRLKSFVLHHRIQSKLLPAKTYLHHVVRDVCFLSSINEDYAKERVEQTEKELEVALPGYWQIIQSQQTIQQSLEQLMQETVAKMESNIKQTLIKAEFDQCVQCIPYPGLLLAWQYAQDVADALASQLEAQLQAAAQWAHHDTAACMQSMAQLTHEHIDTISLPGNEKALPTIGKNHRPIRIHVQARDFTLDRHAIVDKKVVAASNIAALLGTTTVLFKIKDLMLKFVPWRPSANMAGRSCWTGYTLTAVGLLSAYAFVATVPRALQFNLQRKLQIALKNENWIDEQTDRIVSAATDVLEATQIKISYRVQEVVKEMEQNKSSLEDNVFQSKANLHQFKKLVAKSNDLLVKVEGLAL
jgi:mitofusin